MAKSDLPSIYAMPQLYEAFFNPGLADVPFYEAWARDAGGPVLELGCGTGRLLWALRKTGLSVEGLDASAEMLAACRAQGKRHGLEAALHQGDWRSFDLGKRFAGIALPFNGLQHLHRAEDLRAFFERVRQHLLPGGGLALDVHLPQPALLVRDPAERFGVEEGPLAPNGERVVAEQSSYDAWTQVQTQTWTLAGVDGSTREISLGMRQFYPQELRALLDHEGFALESFGGGFEGEELEPGALKQVVRARLVKYAAL